MTRPQQKQRTPPRPPRPPSDRPDRPGSVRSGRPGGRGRCGDRVRRGVVMVLINESDARRRAAFHEAGHAVFAWALDLEVGAVQLFPETDDNAGSAGYWVPSNLPPEDR